MVWLANTARTRRYALQITANREHLTNGAQN